MESFIQIAEPKAGGFNPSYPIECFQLVFAPLIETNPISPNPISQADPGMAANLKPRPSSFFSRKDRKALVGVVLPI